MKKNKGKPNRAWLQGLVSAIFLLLLLCVNVPNTQAVHSEFLSLPVNISMDYGLQSSCATESFSVIADTHIMESDSSTNFGGELTVTMDAGTGSAQGGLFRWDISAIPDEATVESVSLTFYVTATSDHTFNLHNLKRAWTESGANWNTTDGSTAWVTAGAADTTSDRGEENLWITDGDTFSTSGEVTIDLNSDGVDVIQRWVDETSPNHGLTIQNYTGSSSSHWVVAAKEFPGTQGAKLNINYCMPSTTPTLIVTANPNQTKFYGEPDPTFTYTHSDPQAQITGALERDEGENAGTYAINQGTLAAEGYEIEFVPADFTITPLPIEVTADNLTKTLNAPDPELTYQITSGALIDPDTFTGALTRDEGETAGDYSILQGDLAISDGNEGNNYALTFNEGTLTITDSPLPPEMPQVFYGEVRYHAFDDQPQVGDEILAYVDGVANPVGSTHISVENGQLVYLIKVDANDPNTSIKDGADMGDTISFMINERIVATATWQGGSPKQLHIHPPYASTGGPYVGLVDQAIQFNGIAEDWGEDIDTISWDLDGNGQFEDAAILDPEYTYTTPGIHAVSLLVTDAQGGQGLDNTDVVIIKLEGLSQAYDGSPKSVTVIGVNAPYTHTVTYDGSTQEPINVDTYAVVVEVKEGEKKIGMVTAEMIITSNTITLTADAQSKVYGEIDPTLTFTSSDDLTGVVFTGELARAEGEAVGEYLISLGTLSAGDNYNLILEPADLTITPRPITVTAHDLVKIEDEGDPPFTYDLSLGILAFDDDFTGALGRNSGEAVGFYEITQGSLGVSGDHGDQNYDITFVPGTLTISIIQEIELADGWNLVSFSVHPLSTDITDVLASIEGQYSIVYTWDASTSTGNWRKYDPIAPDYAQTLTTLDDSQGFWIYMSSPAILSVQGTYQASTTINLWIAGGGWNLVGFPSSQGANLPDILEGHGFEPGSEYLVFTYIAADPTDPWRVYDPQAPAYGIDLNALIPGLGYWIYVDIDLIWTIMY